MWRRILDWIGDIWVICGWYHSDITHAHIIQISPTYHPDIIHISPTHIQISPTYHPNIIHITQISSKYPPVDIFYNTPTKWKDMARLFQKKLHFEIRLKLHFSSSRYYSNIIQISSRNHPNPNHPESSRYHSVDIDFYNPPTWWKVEF